MNFKVRSSHVRDAVEVLITLGWGKERCAVLAGHASNVAGRDTGRRDNHTSPTCPSRSHIQSERISLGILVGQSDSRAF